MVKSGNERYLYFAFGSNMSAAQMRHRCPGAEWTGTGHLTHHELVFNRYGTHRSGGVASIRHVGDPSCIVYGVVWNLPYGDLLRLDEFEDRQAYERIRIGILTPDGREYQCQAYRAYPQADHIPPHEDYLNIILESAKEAHLPAGYINRIARLGSS